MPPICLVYLSAAEHSIRGGRIKTYFAARIPFDTRAFVREIFRGCQSSSGVEQRTHKPLVGGSNPSSGTSFKAPNQGRVNARRCTR